MYFSKIKLWKAHHLVMPVIAIAVLIFSLISSIYPLPPFPYSLFPYIVLAWVVIGVVLSLLTKHKVHQVEPIVENAN